MAAAAVSTRGKEERARFLAKLAEDHDLAEQGIELREEFIREVERIAG